MRLAFWCEPRDWPPAVRRLVLDRIPAPAAARYLTRPAGLGLVVCEAPALAAAFVLGDLAERGELPGPPALRARAAAVYRRLQRRLERAAAAPTSRAARQLGAVTGREIAGLVALLEWGQASASGAP